MRNYQKKWELQINSFMSLLKLTFKELAGALILYTGMFRLILFFNKKEAKLIVINYHNFSKYNNYKRKRGNLLETGYAENFKKQIQFLKRHFSFVTPQDFYEENAKKRLNVFITFDDGYKDNFDIAYPVLQKNNAKAAFFIVTGVIGTNELLLHDKIRYLVLHGEIEAQHAEKCLREMNSGKPLPKSILDLVNNCEFTINRRLMMNWEELRKMQVSNFDIQPHTHTHSVLYFLSAAAQKMEVKNSIDSIQTNLGVSTTSFAYPNGLYNDATISLMNSFKIDYAFTTIPGVNNKQTDLLQLKRIGINASDSIGVLCLKILLNLKK